MKKQASFLCLFVLLILVTLPACQPAPVILPPPTSTIELPTSTATRTPASCPDAASFGYFTEIYPGSFQLMTTSPEFEWRYLFLSNSIPGSVEGWAEVCVPDSYTLYFSTGPDFSDEIPVQVGSPDLIFNPTYLAIRWVISPPLQPFTVYRWLATGHYGDLDLRSDHVVANKVPQLHSDSFWPPTNMHRNIGVFITGPICEPPGTGIPILDLPADGEIATSLQPTFTWHVSDCMPDAFNINITRITDPGTTPGCTNSNDPADFSMCINQQNPWLDMETYAYNPVSLLDCSAYTWRVRPVVWINEVMESGEWSETRTFLVDSGACASPTPTFIPRLPTATPTLVPVKPTDVPPQVVCAGLSKDECLTHSNECEWVEPATTSGYCEAKP